MKQNLHTMVSVDRRKAALITLLLAVTVIALYWPVRHFDFVQYDDNDYVFDNPDVCRGLSWWGLVWAFVDGHASNYHPLTWLSHMLDCQLFGLNAGAHHVANVVLHSFNAILFFILMLSLTNAIWRSAFIAALFALHPLRVESVAWISERKDVLCGMFFMLLLLAYVRYAKERERHIQTGVSNRSWAFFRSKTFQLSLTAFLLGLLSKPMLVTVPLVLLILDFWPLKRFENQTDTKVFGIPKPVLLEKVPFFVLSIAFGVITLFAQKSSGALKTLSIGVRFENTLYAYASYIPQMLWPHKLSVIYLRPEHVSLAQLAGSVALLGMITLVAVLNLRRRPYLLAGWLWFILMLLPVSGLLTIGDLFMADRYTYLPAIGFSVLVVWSVMEFLEKVFSPFAIKVLASTGAALILIACTYATHLQLRYWQNTETLMTRALQINPKNFVAHINLGVYYGKRGNLDAARFHRAKAEELMPSAEKQFRLPITPNEHPSP